MGKITFDMRRLVLIAVTALTGSLPAHAQLASSDFAYQKPPIQIQQISAKVTAGVRVRDIRFTGIEGDQIPAYLIEPVRGCKQTRYTCAGALFVHWYEPHASNANRSEFLPDSYYLARHGAVCLLVDAMWAKPGWFEHRNPGDDYNASIAQVKNLRRALDVLIHQPGVDPSRIGYVGHDFGMMFGAILAGVDHRIHAAVLIAGTSCLSDWYLLGRKLDAEPRRKLKMQLSPLCPILYLSHAMGPVLLQFGNDDPYVPVRNAQSLADAAPEPKRIRYYDGGHTLNGQARMERLEWLAVRLRLRPREE
jgi:dienelactone hydrolase